MNAAKAAGLLLAANSAEAAPYTRAQFKEHVASEVRAWGDVVRAAGLTVY